MSDEQLEVIVPPCADCIERCKECRERREAFERTMRLFDEYEGRGIIVDFKGMYVSEERLKAAYESLSKGEEMVKVGKD